MTSFGKRGRFSNIDYRVDAKSQTGNIVLRSNTIDSCRFRVHALTDKVKFQSGFAFTRTRIFCAERKID